MEKPTDFLIMCENSGGYLMEDGSLSWTGEGAMRFDKRELAESYMQRIRGLGDKLEVVRAEDDE